MIFHFGRVVNMYIHHNMSLADPVFNHKLSKKYIYAKISHFLYEGLIILEYGKKEKCYLVHNKKQLNFCFLQNYIVTWEMGVW